MTNASHMQLTLISHRLCPYVQRAVIALEELDIAYERIDIDLENPPEWFIRLSPLGKVPVLLVDEDQVLFESAVIAEYINEAAGGGLLSTGLIEKARERAWIEFASATLDNIGALYNAATEKSFTRVANQLESRWRQLEQNLQQTRFFAGDEFSLVDGAFAPVFRYLDLFDKLVDIDFTGRFQKVERWRKTLAERASVQKAVSPEYQTLLAEFIAGRNSHLGARARTFLDNQVAA